ncbi:MAG: polysaccharide pyruvyl transferase family protein [Phycisphaerae bacterium]
MRIGLIGWYGHENAGDERILYCLKRFFVDHDLYVTGWYEDALSKIEALNTCDFVLLGGGGLVIRGLNNCLPLLEGLKTRWGCVGISVEAANKDNAKFIQFVKEHAEFILVRDRRSKELLGQDGVLVAPDLTFLYPFSVSTPVAVDRCGVNLRPWHFWPSEYRSKHYYQMLAWTKRIPFLEQCYPFPKWNPRRALAIIQRDFADLVPIPLYFERDQENDQTVLQTYFEQVDHVFAPTSLAACRFLVGMRLHALIFACQMGIPFVSLSYQPKNVEFCKALGLESLSVDLFRMSHLKRAIAYLKAEYDHVRQNLMDYCREAQRDITDTMQVIQQLIVRSRHRRIG